MSGASFAATGERRRSPGGRGGDSRLHLSGHSVMNVHCLLPSLAAWLWPALPSGCPLGIPRSGVVWQGTSLVMAPWRRLAAAGKNLHCKSICLAGFCPWNLGQLPRTPLGMCERTLTICPQVIQAHCIQVCLASCLFCSHARCAAANGQEHEILYPRVAHCLLHPCMSSPPDDDSRLTASVAAFS